VNDPLLREQIDYYRARAGEYDQWFLRQGRYDLGPVLNDRWHTEVKQVEERLETFGARGRVLELAGGTGFWTRHLARTAEELVVVDASPETLELNRQRVRRPDVRYIVADLFNWQADATYDVVAFTFWLSHVPPDRFVNFWRLVEKCFDIYKVFYTPEELTRRLADLGWHARIASTQHFLLYGEARRTPGFAAHEAGAGERSPLRLQP
jgi:demethylmenaquinone methyltransferase/2-methoxy-6-polyprenyl-1,4-benzoquinol methylase